MALALKADHFSMRDFDCSTVSGIVLHQRDLSGTLHNQRNFAHSWPVRSRQLKQRSGDDADRSSAL